MTMTIERMMTAKVAEGSADIAARYVRRVAAEGGGHSKFEDVRFLRLTRGLGFYYFARPRWLRERAGESSSSRCRAERGSGRL